MRLALINGGIVQNIISAEFAFAQTLGYEQVVEATDGAASQAGPMTGAHPKLGCGSRLEPQVNLGAGALADGGLGLTPN